MPPYGAAVGEVAALPPVGLPYAFILPFLQFLGSTTYFEIIIQHLQDFSKSKNGRIWRIFAGAGRQSMIYIQLL